MRNDQTVESRSPNAMHTFYIEKKTNFDLITVKKSEWVKSTYSPVRPTLRKS